MTVTDPSAAGAGSLSLGFEAAVLADDVPGGVAFVPAVTPLTRLNYYDGRFLRADDLNLEQRAQRALVEMSNQAGGPGPVHGFDISLGGGKLGVSGGLAIDPRGRVLYLPDLVDAPVADLVAATQRTVATAGPATTPGVPSFAPCDIATTTAPTVPTVSGAQLYLVAIAHAEGLCGNAEVFGRLCDDACITATDRPYRLDGVVLLLLPLDLTSRYPLSTAVSLTGTHLRSRIASAFYAQEWAAGGSLLSAAGLRTNVWCSGAAALLGEVVPLGILSWSGPTGSFVDEWTARRERMEPPPRAYWAGRLEMRTWPGFLAQVLQFQCQLSGLLVAPPPSGGGPDDPCADTRLLLGESSELLDKVKELLSGGGELVDHEVDESRDASFWRDFGDEGLLRQFEELADRVGQALAAPTPGPARLLIDWGIVELPSAGYLPIDKTSTLTIREQAQRFMGGGVDLRVCAVRRDQIAHELERAQHMERISLLSGLEPAAPLEEVDILVPDGAVVTSTTDAGRGFAVDLSLGLAVFGQSDPEREEAAAEAAEAATEEFPRAAAPLAEHHLSAVNDKRRVPLMGAGRLDLRGGRLEACVGAVGPVGKGGAALLRAVSAMTSDSEPTVRAARRLDVGTEEADSAEALRLEREVMEAVMARRAGESRGRVASLADSPTRPLVSLWATASLEADPFTAGSGTRIGINATVRFVVPDDSTMSLNVDFFGHVTPGTPTRSGGVETVPLAVDIFVDSETVNVSRGRERDEHLRFDVTLERNAAGELRLATEEHHDGQWIALGGWGGAPVKAWGVGGVTMPDQEGEFEGIARPGGFPAPALPLLIVTATEDSTIGEVGNLYHQAAERAVVLVEAGPPTSESRLAKLQRLFPPAGDAVIDILPTTDWVLFRRRRSEDCGDRALPAAPPARVAGWVVNVTGPKSETLALRVAEALSAGQASEVPWQSLGAVEFEPSSATLADPAAWRSAYAGRGGTHVTFVGYAANGTGDTLGLDRSVALVEALAADGVVADPTSPLAEEVPPPTALEAGTLGSAYLVTWTDEPEPEPELGCIEVWCAHPELSGPIRDPNPADLEPSENSEMLHPIAEIRWTGTTIDASTLQQLFIEFKICLDRMAQLLDQPVRAAGVGWIHKTWADDHVAEAQAQLEEIVAELGITLAEPDAQVVDFEIGDRCPIRLYLVIEAVIIP